MLGRHERSGVQSPEVLRTGKGYTEGHPQVPVREESVLRSGATAVAELAVEGIGFGGKKCWKNMAILFKFETNGVKFREVFNVVSVNN